MALVLSGILIVIVLHPTWLRPAVGPAVLAYVLGFMLVAILDLNVQARLTTTRVDAARIRYLFAGGLAVLTLHIIENLGHVFDIDPPPVGLVATLLYLYVISQAIVQYRIFDLYEMLGRFVVLTMMGATLTIIYILLVFWAGRGFGLAVNTFLASLIILLLFDPLRDFVEQKIGDFFFGERHILEQNVVALRRRLAHVIDINTMVEVLFEGLEDSRRVTHASLFLIDPHGHGFERRGSVGPEPSISRLDVVSAKRHLRLFPASSAIVRTQLVERRSTALQSNKRDVAEQIGETLEMLDSMSADLLLPVEGELDLLGFLSVRDEKTKDAFSAEEIVLLTGLASQVAITVENSQMYQQMKERDRLAALGEMSAGLAHEIRNPLGAIKAAAQFIEDEVRHDFGKYKEDSNDEFLSIIVEEVDRLNHVVSDFLAYARPSAQSATEVNINEILKRTLQVFETGREDKVDLLVQCHDGLPGVEINGERLHQIFFNLVINAVQAMEGQKNARLEIVTRRRTLRRQGRRGNDLETSQFVEVRFADNGPGISPSNLENVFIPFFTTKQKGSGLGLSVCQRIVKDAGGEIELRSQEGQGAIFTVVLPACEPKRSSTNPELKKGADQASFRLS